MTWWKLVFPLPDKRNIIKPTLLMTDKKPIPETSVY